jgi:adenosylhomocysteine nucleosidase
VNETVLISFAVREEAAPFRRRVAQGSGVRVLITGMGPASAERAMRAALDSYAPCAVITAGFAGGLASELAHGEVLFCADPQFPWLARLIEAGARPGKFHCAARVAVTAPEKAALRQSTGADAVEMESGVIRELCGARRIPSATVRVVSDTADEDLPLDFNALLTETGRLNPFKLAWALMAGPGKIPALLALQRRTRQAANRLARILQAVVHPGREVSRPQP